MGEPPQLEASAAGRIDAGQTRRAQQPLLDADKRIEFLQALVKDAGTPQQTGEGVGSPKSDQIELCYLPSLGPQPHPEERLNADLNHEIGKRVLVRPIKMLLFLMSKTGAFRAGSICAGVELEA